MRVSYRSALTSGVVALTATAVVAAPAITPVAQPISEKAVVSAPVQNTAAVSPWRLPSPLGADSAIKLIVPSAAKALPQPPSQAAASPAPTALPLPNPPSTGFIMNVYNAVEPWVRYGFEVAEWAVGWVPWIGLLAGQIGILYDAAEVLVRSWFQAAQDLVKLNLANIPATLINGVTDGLRTLVQGEIDWLFGWLPPLPPIGFTRTNLESAAGNVLDPIDTAINRLISPLSSALSGVTGQSEGFRSEIRDLVRPNVITLNADARTEAQAADVNSLPLVGSLGAEAQKIGDQFEGLARKFTEQLDPSKLLTGVKTKALFSRDGESTLPMLRGLRTAVNEELEKTTERVSTRIDTVTTKLTESFTPTKDGESKGFTPKTKIGKAMQSAAKSVATKLSSLKPSPKQRSSAKS